MHGHAAATVGTQMWIAGGRYGRKLLRSFFCFDTGAYHFDMLHWLTALAFMPEWQNLTGWSKDARVPLDSKH